jgi:hypothetical protein
MFIYITERRRSYRKQITFQSRVTLIYKSMLANTTTWTFPLQLLSIFCGLKTTTMGRYSYTVYGSSLQTAYIGKSQQTLPIYLHASSRRTTHFSHTLRRTERERTDDRHLRMNIGLTNKTPSPPLARASCMDVARRHISLPLSPFQAINPASKQ